MEMHVYENQLHLHIALTYTKMFMTFGSISVNWISNTLITALLRKYNHKTGHSTNQRLHIHCWYCVGTRVTEMYISWTTGRIHL
jgi:hypothetical protein